MAVGVVVREASGTWTVRSYEDESTARAAMVADDEHSQTMKRRGNHVGNHITGEVFVMPIVVQ